jgi:hypothetical protein|tara:strand:- start:306 stop:533 length:228 start_codon:yes stop_codon:yes gene_type:complete
MNLEEDFELEEFLFVDRQCRKCLRTLTLVDHFYKTRPDRGKNMSAYSYICKQCTVKRNAAYRKKKRQWITDYPDW